MNTLFILGIMLGMLGALLLNIGKGVQKQKVHVFLNGRKMFAAEHRGDLGIWLVGLAMTASAILPYTVALKLTNSPSTISAMTGIGLIGLMIYALKVIGEKIKLPDAIGIALVIIGTSLLGALGAEKEHVAREFSTMLLFQAISATFLLMIALIILARYWKRIHGLAWGLTAGCCIGSSIFLGDIALVSADGSLSGQLATPYPYIALVFAMSATVTTQIGFIKGRALEVVPAVNSTVILAPLLFEVLIYGQIPALLALLLILCIVTGVLLLSTGAAAKVAA